MLTIAERRRLVVAVALTVLLVPLALFSRGSSDPNQPAVSTVATGDEPAAPAFLPVQGSSVVPDIITVNVPAPPEDIIIKGNASFFRYPDIYPDIWGPRPCATSFAPIGAKVEVRNLNNGRTTKCENRANEGLVEGISILMDTDIFLEIADLVDAPLPVEIVRRAETNR